MLVRIVAEMRIEFTGTEAEIEQKRDIAIETAKMSTKHWMATMMLISDKRKPLVHLEAGDHISPNEEISLVDDLDIPVEDTLAKAKDAAGVDDGNA